MSRFVPVEENATSVEKCQWLEALGEMAVLTGFMKSKQVVVRFVVNWGPGNHNALSALVRSASCLFWGSWEVGSPILVPRGGVAQIS